MAQVSAFRGSFVQRRSSQQCQVRAQRRLTVLAQSKVQFTFIGDGSMDHLEERETKNQVMNPPPQVLELENGVYELGRVAPADIIVDIPTVSSRHALLRIEGDSVSVTDLNSTNGTYLQGEECKPMAQVQIPLDSEIYFGDQHLAHYKLEKVDESSETSEKSG